MEPTTFKAMRFDNGWGVCALAGKSEYRHVANGIGSEETARTIAALLNMNSFSAAALETGAYLILKTNDPISA